jgi:hypothetical protein
LRKFIQFIYKGNYDDEDHLSPEGCDEAVLQPIDEILSSLRHGTDIPGSNFYITELWNETRKHRNSASSSRGSEVCGGCDACLCDLCDPDETRLCAFDNNRNYNYGGYLCPVADETYPETESEDHSSNEDEDDKDDEMDGDIRVVDLRQWPAPDPTLGRRYQERELLYPDDDGYVTALPHAMFTSVRVYAMADMFCVPALKILARNRFYKAVEMHAYSADFPDVVDEVFETTAPDDWVLKEICVLIIRTRCLGNHCDENLMAALQPVFCRHEDIVQRMQLLPELEGRYFEEGRLHKHETEDRQEGVDGDEVGSGWVSLPDRTPPTDQEEA